MQRVGPFILGRTLGVGSTGKVKLGTHEDTGDRVAIKIVNKEFLASRPSLGRKIQREIAILKLIDFPHVLHLFDVYETSKNLFLVLEYVSGGELFDYLVSRGRLEPAEALVFFQHIIAGVDCCHQHLICHRDLKPENLLLDASKQVKIADFGMATLVKPGSLLATSCGSPHYASPEVVMGIKYDGRPADIWSSGVILYALLTGKLPFDDNNIRKLLTKVKEGQFTIPSHVSSNASDLIRRMMNPDPARRITIEQIKQHAWFTSNGAIMPKSFTPFDQNTLVKPIPSIEDDLVGSLVALGFGETRSEVRQALVTQTATLEKVFYYLFENHRRNSPPTHEDRGREREKEKETHTHRRVDDDETMDMDDTDADALLFQNIPGPGIVHDSPTISPADSPDSMTMISTAGLEDDPLSLMPGAAGTPIPPSFMVTPPTSAAVPIPYVQTSQRTRFPSHSPLAPPHHGSAPTRHPRHREGEVLGEGGGVGMEIEVEGSSSGVTMPVNINITPDARGAASSGRLPPTAPIPVVPSSFSGDTAKAGVYGGTPRFHRNHRLDVPDFMSPAVGASPQTRWFGSAVGMGMNLVGRGQDDAPLIGASQDGIFVLNTHYNPDQVSAEVQRVFSEIGVRWSVGAGAAAGGSGGGGGQVSGGGTGNVMMARFDPEDSSSLFMRIELVGTDQPGVNALRVILDGGERAIFTEFCRRLLHLLRV